MKVHPLLYVVILFFIWTNLSAQQSAHQLFNRGYSYISTDRERAISLLSQCIKEDPGYTLAYYHRGIAYFKNGEYDDALQDFNKAYELNPQLSILWMYKGFAYRNMGELDEAVNSFSNYISKHPTDTTAYSYILRGKMKYEQGDFQGAVEDYDLALRLKPFEEKYQYYRFIALYDDKQYKQSLEAVNRLITLNPAFYGYYLYKGNVLRSMKEYFPAIYMYNIAILKNSNNADCYFYRGLCYQALDKCFRAIEDFDEAVKREADDAYYFVERGNCKLKTGDKSGACADWKQADAMGYYKDSNTVPFKCE